MPEAYSDAWHEIGIERGRIEQVKENSGRLAKVFAHYTTTGWGEIAVPEVIEFDCTFLTEPTFTSGIALADRIELLPNRFPRVTAGVYRWRKNAKQQWTGAWVFFCVDTFSAAVPTSSLDPNYVLHHHLSFEAVAYKDVLRNLSPTSVDDLLSVDRELGP